MEGTDDQQLPLFVTFIDFKKAIDSDPFWDISLDLGNIDHSNGNGRSSSGASAASTPEEAVMQCSRS